MTVSIYTSLSPTHVLGDEQQRCLRSWMDAGYHATCVQAYCDTVNVPKGARRVDVEPSKGYRRPYIYLDSLVHQALEDGVDYAIITNSDIELVSDNRHHLGRAGMTIGRRINHSGEWSKGKAEEWGIDVFILDRATLERIPKSLFVLGQTWWDYWLPFWAIEQGIALHLARPMCYGHRTHKQQWSVEEWHRMTTLFQGTTGHLVGTKPHDCGMKVWRLIGEKAKRWNT